mgnify:CR=1 FL=1
MTVWGLVTLALLIATAGLGLASLMSWWPHRSAGFPSAKIAIHATLQLVSIGLWASFLVTESLALAWTTFSVITLGQVFGDLLMFASYHLRHPENSRLHYLKAAGDVLSFRRVVPALHAIIGAVAWFTMLAICLIATFA